MTRVKIVKIAFEKECLGLEVGREDNVGHVMGRLMTHLSKIGVVKFYFLSFFVSSIILDDILVS